MDIFRKKDVSKSRTGMKRHLKIHDLILLGIGAMVGTGISPSQVLEQPIMLVRP